eukprot:361181-Chlamydomonas_euryale.AAC.3
MATPKMLKDAYRKVWGVERGAWGRGWVRELHGDAHDSQGRARWVGPVVRCRVQGVWGGHALAERPPPTHTHKTHTITQNTTHHPLAPTNLPTSPYLIPATLGHSVGATPAPRLHHTCATLAQVCLEMHPDKRLVGVTDEEEKHKVEEEFKKVRTERPFGQRRWEEQGAAGVRGVCEHGGEEQRGGGDGGMGVGRGNRGEGGRDGSRKGKQGRGGKGEWEWGGKRRPVLSHQPPKGSSRACLRVV